MRSRIEMGRTLGSVSSRNVKTRPFSPLLCDLLWLSSQSGHARQGRGRVLRTVLVWVALLLSTYQGSIKDKSISSISSTRSVSLLCLQKHTNTVRRVTFVLHLTSRMIHPCLFESRATTPDTPSKSIRLFMSTISLDTSIVKCTFLIYHEHKTSTIYHSLWTLSTLMTGLRSSKTKLAYEMDHRGSARPSHRDVGSLYVRSLLTPTFLACARVCKRCLPPCAETNRRRP